MPKRIGELSSMPDPNIYRRGNGETYLKLNETHHIPVTSGDNGDGEPVWEGDGSAEEFDPDEEVEVIQ